MLCHKPSFVYIQGQSVISFPKSKTDFTIFFFANVFFFFFFHSLTLSDIICLPFMQLLRILK